MKLKRSTKILTVIFVIVLVIVFFQVPLHRFTGQSQTISKQTTYLTEPVRDDGGISYLQHMNVLLSRDVTPDNNALIALSRYLKSETGYSGQAHDKFCAALGVTDIPLVDHFEGHYDYINAKYPPADVDAQIKLREEFDRVTTKPWAGEDFPKWAEAVDAQNRPLNGIVEATRLPRYYHPYICEGGDADELAVMAVLSLAQMNRHAARGLSSRAMRSIGEGRIEDAIHDVKAMRRLAALSSQTGTYVEQLIAIAVSSMAANCEKYCIASRQMTREQLEDYRRSLRETDLRNNYAWRMEHFGRFLILDVIQQQNLYGGNPKLGLERIMMMGNDHSWQASVLSKVSSMTDWNAAMATANQQIDRAVQASRESNDRLRIEKLKLLDNEFNDIRERAQRSSVAFPNLLGGAKARGRWAGSIIAAGTLPAMSLIAETEVRDLVQRDLVELGLALELYQLDHGSYPEKLADLSPKYLDEIPLDRFSDAPITYKKTRAGYLMYSVGPDGVDDGGKAMDDDYSGGNFDLTFSVGDPNHGKKE